MELITFIMELMVKYPIFGSILFVIGAFRVVFKPIMSAAQSYVEYTPNPVDNVVLTKIMESSVYKAVAFVLDFAASIKIPAAK